MIRLRKEETRYCPGGAGGGYDDGPLPAEDIVGLYEEVLSELTFNSKPMIGDLTAIAGEQREHARGIASSICNRILKVPADQKLPSLYLLDSIVKNVGREYVVHFSACLPKVFCEAYNQVDSSLHPAMRHLLGTWSQVFHPSVLRKIEDELHFSTPLNQRVTGLMDRRYSESPSPGPTHGIHVNPKYLERRVVGSCSDEDRINLEGDPVEILGRNTSESPERWSGVNPKFHDVRHLKGVSSGLQVYERKPCIQIGDYGFDSFESLSPGHEIARPVSPETTAMRASSMVGVERPLPYLKSRRSRSPPRNGIKRSLSPVNGRFQRDISFERGERASPSHSGHGFGHERVHDQNGWLDRRWRSDNDAQSQESSTGHDLKNIYSKQRSRELIDAYGDHRETGNFHEKRPKVQQLDVIGITSKTTTRNWQSSEEEEFIWEDMSPTLANHDNRKSLQPFRPSNERPGSSRPGDILLEHDLRRGDRADQASLHPLVDEDKIPLIQYGHGSLNKYLDDAESQNEPLLEYKSSRHLQDPGKPYSFQHNSQQIRGPNSQRRVPEYAYSVGATIPSFGQNLPAPHDHLPDAEMPFRRSPGFPSGNSNVYPPALEKHWARRQYTPPRSAPVIRPPLPLVAIPPNRKHLEGNKPEIDQGPNLSSVLPQQHYDRRFNYLNGPLQSSGQSSGSVNVRPQSQEPSTSCQFQDAPGSFLLPAQPRGSSYLVPQPPSYVQTQGHDVKNSLPEIPSSYGMQSLSDTGFHMPSGALPPLPTGPHRVSLPMGPSSQNISSILSSGLISSLMSQGLISLKPPGQSQDSVGVEFNTEVLKVRHESTVNALYADLPRQCTTCGLRFRCQEEHSSHMDWHVTKNRVSKNRKQQPSRKWFVSGKEWLSGAEVLGTDVVPGFLPTEAVTENKGNTEMAVPADENQTTCALCGELFEDFYSDETEEWMYKHAVYLNARNGSIESLDISQRGPIVHDKCRPEALEDT